MRLRVPSLPDYEGSRGPALTWNELVDRLKGHGFTVGTRFDATGKGGIYLMVGGTVNAIPFKTDVMLPCTPGVNYQKYLDEFYQLIALAVERDFKGQA